MPKETKDFNVVAPGGVGGEEWDGEGLLVCEMRHVEYLIL